MNPPRYVLTPENYDGVTSALIGNGELCTTVGPTGYHTPPEEQTDIAHRTQHFVLAGRRCSGPQHRLVNFGYMWRTLLVDGKEVALSEWNQEIDYPYATIESVLTHGSLTETCGSFVSLAQNAFVAATLIRNSDSIEHAVAVKVRFQFGERDAAILSKANEGGVLLNYSIDGQLGDIFFGASVPSEPESIVVQAEDQGASASVELRLKSDRQILIHAWIQFSDRLLFQFPDTSRSPASVSDRSELHERLWWAECQSQSEVKTGNECVDMFRRASTYTLRCQATPWSVPPTVSEEYWGAGAFHDEMYPFLGLLSSNHTELAERIPYFRLSTLPQAMQRARGRGALYPWSSTEYGEERDPNGLWLTERFHLGQFAVCIWMLWLYNRDRIQLDDLYPVLREIARYFEMNMLERDEEGRLRTKACVDFDESVGPVTNGPFTICAAIASMEYAANAAEELGKDALRIPWWRELAGELRENLPVDRTTGDTGKEVFGIPGEKPLHYSILGPTFPFRVEVESERARDSAEYIHRVCRSTKGWKPGFSKVFEGSNWMWTAAHLGIVHAMQGNAELAWEAIKEAPASAGPFLSPNEHVDKDGVVHVPWFTTGCGGWLYALNCLFVQVDEEGTKLLAAVPSALPNARFRDLRADSGVLVSAAFDDDALADLTARSPKPMSWTYRIPSKYAKQVRFRGTVEELPAGWLNVTVELQTDSTSLIEAS